MFSAIALCNSSHFIAINYYLYLFAGQSKHSILNTECSVSTQATQVVVVYCVVNCHVSM